MVAGHRLHRLVAGLDRRKFLLGLIVFAGLVQIHGLREFLRLDQIDRLRLGDSHIEAINRHWRFPVADFALGGGNDPNVFDGVRIDDQQGLRTKWPRPFLRAGLWHRRGFVPVEARGLGAADQDAERKER